MQAILDVRFRQDVFFLFGMRKVVSKTPYTTKTTVTIKQSVLCGTHEPKSEAVCASGSQSGGWATWS